MNEEEINLSDLFDEQNSTGEDIIKTKDNTLYKDIYEETKKISLYIDESINNFHLIFKKNFKNFNDSLLYLKKIDIPNNCICGRYLDSGWRCLDCSKVNNSVICNKCYKKSNYLHKGHKMLYLIDGEGMCDCGDPNVLKTFCSEHNGPFKNDTQINEYISKVFENDILKNLILFFDEFFLKFSEYLLLTEKCEYFTNDIFYESFYGKENDEKKDIIFLKNNFCEIFKKFLNFLLSISKNNFGILQLILINFTKNHFKRGNIYENCKTSHSCIKILDNDIKIINNNNNEIVQNHVCECPFLRLLLSNWRKEIKSENNNYEQFLYTFVYNLPLKRAFCIIFFKIYKTIILNYNKNIILNINQFLIENELIFLANNSTLIEDNYEIFYNIFSYKIKLLNSKKINGIKNEFNNTILQTLEDISGDIRFVTMHYTHPKIKEILSGKTSMIKRVFDCICLIHNDIEFKSILPHPQFQNKSFSKKFINLEEKLLNIIKEISMFIQWNNYNQMKDIFIYIINKIINQKSEGIKQLEYNEYSFHLSLYRAFGLMINYFCFNYSLNNKCNLIDSIHYFKNNFFKSLEECETFTNILLSDYFKFFGFIFGIKNSFFNYYNSLKSYYSLYFNDNSDFLKIDFTLLKYLFSLSEQNIDINLYLEKSNLEYCYSIFEKYFFKFNNSIYDEYDNKDLENMINQWISLLELLIILMKNNETPFSCLMEYYIKCHSLETQRNLFNNIKMNNYIIIDMKNILKDKIVHNIIIKSNLCKFDDIENCLQKVDEYIFEEKYIHKVLNELTLTRMIGENKYYYLKDSSFKYLDMNYYFSQNDKSKAQNYILDFKKDIIKLYNMHFFNPSQMTFEFCTASYEKLLLNKKNLELIIIIIEKIVSISEQSESEYTKDFDSFKLRLLPVILNYLLIFSKINTKSFLKFKNENRDLIDQLSQILSNSIINNQKNNRIQKDIEENINEVIKQLKNYEFIYEKYNDLKEYDYNIENININDKKYRENTNEENNNKSKIKHLKQKLKSSIKNKNNNFIKLNDEIIKSADDIKNKIDENMKDSNEEIICCLCRKYLKLDSFDEPYGSTGALYNDFFYVNSLNSTIRTELSKLKNGNSQDNIFEQNNKIFDDSKKNQ